MLRTTHRSVIDRDDRVRGGVGSNGKRNAEGWGAKGLAWQYRARSVRFVNGRR